MYEHSCKRAGAEGCGFRTTASTEQELRDKVTAHAKKVHGLKYMTDTIYEYVRRTAAS